MCFVVATRLGAVFIIFHFALKKKKDARLSTVFKTLYFAVEEMNGRTVVKILCFAVKETDVCLGFWVLPRRTYRGFIESRGIKH